MRAMPYASVYVVRPVAGGHELLLGRRAEGQYMGGTWQLISGGIEPDETAWQAAVREVKEETGLAVRELYRLTQVEPFYRADVDAIGIAVMFCAIVDPAAQVSINPEHTHLEWVPIDAAAGRLMWPGDIKGLAEMRTHILGDSSIKPHLRVPIDAA
ncbi:MAG TPA: NUDIX domain-containing protein [Tepidisphaeraceae bacterium]|jgi:dATP pyrophosphohydrolase